MKKQILVSLAVLMSAALHAADVRVTWKDNSAIEEGYIIERAPVNDSGASPPASAFIRVGTVPANTQEFVDKGLPSRSKFAYRVRAFIGIEVFSPSNVSTCTTLPTVPITPTETKATPISGTPQ